MGLGRSLEWATQLPASAAQLHPAAPDPLRVSCLRPEPSHRRPAEGEAPNDSVLAQVYGGADQTGRTESQTAR